MTLQSCYKFKNTLSLSFGERKIDVNSTLISAVRFAQFDNSAVIARVVVDLKNAYKYEISANGEFNHICLS